MARLIMLLCCLAANLLQASESNGFDLSNAAVPRDEIVHGGPPRDGIPAIDQPRFVSAGSASLDDNDRVLGLVIAQAARAYPIKILNWHELINDTVAQRPVLISYCPLCGTGMAFSAELDGKRLTFGVSGLLYNSDVLFYDRQSQSLWSQIANVAISGPRRGRSLIQLPLAHTTWASWRNAHPESLVLEGQPGYREYTKNPYAGYDKTRQLYFKVANKIPRGYHTKERVLGIEINDTSRAYPFTELRKHGETRFFDELAGQRFEVVWDAGSASAYAVALDGRPIPTTTAFWFAWYAFHPDTEIFSKHKPVN